LSPTSSLLTSLRRRPGSPTREEARGGSLSPSPTLDMTSLYLTPRPRCSGRPTEYAPQKARTYAGECTLVEGEGERAVEIFGRESFDAVLCHGALMYLEDSRPMIQNLTAIARPGALISVLAKNASALAMRPALEGRYGEALDALDADRDLGRLEAVTRGEEARERFGDLLVLDVTTPTRVSVLCTAEPFDSWRREAAFFTSAETPDRVHLIETINDEIGGVSPYISRGEDGWLERSWRCRSLLQATYMMLYLDLTSDNTIRKCQRGGCPDYFRVGAQCKSKYCTERCANAASTRMRRGQEP
jgi:SAM-dependent methyltransferase